MNKQQKDNYSCIYLFLYLLITFIINRRNKEYTYIFYLRFEDISLKLPDAMKIPFLRT